MASIERKRSEGEGRERRGGNPYLYLTMGIGFVLAAVMIIFTTGAAVSGIGFVIPAAIFLGLSLNEFQKQRSTLPRPANKERELLSAIRDNGGTITPAEAAMETTLTVREADAMLTELASGGHVMVERRNSALFYSLPSREDPALEG